MQYVAITHADGGGTGKNMWGLTGSMNIIARAI